MPTNFSGFIHWRNDKDTSSTVDHADRKSDNIYFLKISKTGLTTLYNIFARYAWLNKLRVATYKSKPYPAVRPILQYLSPFFIEGKSAKFHMSLDHSTYDQKQLDKILEKPLTHVTMIRHPVSWLDSFLHYEGIITKFGLNKGEAVHDLLNKLSNSTGFLLKNRQLMALQKWMPYSYFKNYTIESIQKIDDLFFVGISEYFDESLIMLRRRLGWPIKDVIDSPLRVATYKRQSDKSEQLYKRTCKWIPETCHFYEFFNASFWKKFHHKENDIRAEVYEYKSILRKQKEFCAPFFEKMKSKSTIFTSHKRYLLRHVWFGPSKWDEGFNYSFTDCALSMISPYTYRPMFYYRQNSNDLCTEECPLPITSR